MCGTFYWQRSISSTLMWLCSLGIWLNGESGSQLPQPYLLSCLMYHEAIHERWVIHCVRSAGKMYSVHNYHLSCYMSMYSRVNLKNYYMHICSYLVPFRLLASCTHVSGLHRQFSPSSSAIGSSMPMEESEENLPVTSIHASGKHQKEKK